MVLKRKKFKNEPTGNTGNRKGYRSRSSESQLPNKRMSNADLKRAATLLPKRRAESAIIEAETLMDYYKDLIK
tara:strand:- start:67 stop:285 length:219 start_codon:yes stop_codon:yes gene_type:complete